MFKKFTIQFLILFLLVNSLGFFFFPNRPLFYYEYAIVILLLAFAKNSKLIFKLFIFLFILDLFNINSNIYLFTLREFFSSLQFIALYKINSSHFFYFLFLISFVVLIYYYFKKIFNNVKSNKKVHLKTTLIIYFVIILLDIVNGSSKLNEKEGTFLFTQKNISAFLVKNYWLEINESFINPVLVKQLKTPPVILHTLRDDSTGNQLIILVESWGLIKDSTTQEAFQAYLSEVVKNKGYQYQFGKNKFSGSTASSEIRNLLGVTGKYEYFLHHRSDTNNIVSIFNYKNKQGYITYGFHSFSENMFNRAVWWKNIGIQHTYFKEDFNLAHKNTNNKLIEDSPFPSVDDVDMFNYMLDITKYSSKSFSYLLTVNSHLPFKLIIVEKNPYPKFKI